MQLIILLTEMNQWNIYTYWRFLTWNDCL